MKTMQSLDQGALLQLKSLNTADGSGPLLNRLIDVYQSEAPKLMTRLIKASRVGNLGELEMAAHTLKSSSAQLGAIEFSDTCKALEMIGKGKEDENCHSLVALIDCAKNQLDQVIDLLEESRI